MLEPRQYCSFLLDGHLFGVEVMEIQEVIRYQRMTKVPLAPSVIEGLINLRGQIVTAIDLRRMLALPARTPGDLPMNIVVRSEDSAISLLVDEIGEVVEVHDDQFETPPETLLGPARDLISGAYKLADRLLLVLDTAKAVHVGADLTR